MNQATQDASFTNDSSPTTRTIAGRAYAAKGAASPLLPFSFTRRSPRAQDVQIEILYCGVCHSDLHQTRDEWKRTRAAHANSFFRAFQQWEGTSPGEWRAQSGAPPSLISR
jgi:hypothetical protein